MGRRKAPPRRAAQVAHQKNSRKVKLENIIIRWAKQHHQKPRKKSANTFVKTHWYSVSSVKGMRDYMEDTFDINTQKEGYSAFGVFDGHGGDLCSQYLKEEMLTTILEHSTLGEKPLIAIKDAFEIMDSDFSQVALEQKLGDGSTCTVAIIDHSSSTPILYVANVGDSRCIVVKSSGQVTALTRDHSGELEDECIRIKQGGGKVIMCDGIPRVQGVLAVTRAIGDAVLKPHVSGTPEIVTLQLDDEYSFLCIASDGIWDVLSNEEVGEILLKDGIENGTKKITTLALKRASDDNLTFMAVDISSLSLKELNLSG